MIMQPFYSEKEMVTEWLAYVDEGGEMPYNEYKLYNPMVRIEERAAA